MVWKVGGEIGIELEDQNHEIVTDFTFCKGGSWRGVGVDPGLDDVLV